MYRSIVGSLMYLVKFQWPELANYVRELAKGMAGATKQHGKEMLRTLRWVVGTPTRAFRMKPERESKVWRIKGICDASFAPEL